MTLVGLALAVVIAACVVAAGEYLGRKDAQRLRRDWPWFGRKDV